MDAGYSELVDVYEDELAINERDKERWTAQMKKSLI